MDRMIRQSVFRCSSAELQNSDCWRESSSSMTLRGEVHRLTSNLQCRWSSIRYRVIIESSGSIERGRTTTPRHRSSADGRAHLFVKPCCRRLRFGGEGLGAFSSSLLRPFGTTLGWLGQKLDRIGATGDMVYRLRVACWRDAGHCRLQPRSARQKGGPDLFWVIHYKTRLDRPGEPKVGTRDPGGQPQRAPECSDGLDGSDGWVPGRERG